MNRSRRVTLVATAALLLSAAACKKSEPAAPAQAGAPSTGGAVPAVGIRVGATLPLTGAEARSGGFYKEGYDLAFEEVAKAGGLEVAGKKIPITLTLLDDTSAQSTAVNLADRLINNDKVDFLLGTYASHLVEAQSTVAEQNKVPYVEGGGGSVGIFKRGFKYVFGLLAPIQALADAQMKWIDAQQKAGKLPRPAKIALVWENTAHGKEFREGVLEFVKKNPADYSVDVDEAFELNGKDFSALLNQVKSKNTDLFLADAHLPDYISMQRQYVTSGLCHKVQSYGARGSEKGAVDALGQPNVNYILSAVWWNAQLGDKGLAKSFTDAFKAKYNRAPEWYQALGYETARALFVAIQQAGSADREKVREKLAAMNIDSILPGGKLVFDEAHGGQAIYPFVVQQNQPDGTSPLVYPPDVAKVPGVAPNPKCAAAQ